MCKNIIASVEHKFQKNAQDKWRHIYVQNKTYIRFSFDKSYNIFFSGTYSKFTSSCLTHRSEDEKIFSYCSFSSLFTPEAQTMDKEARKKFVPFSPGNFSISQTLYISMEILESNKFSVNLSNFFLRPFSISIHFFPPANCQWKVVQCQATQSSSASWKFIVK